MIKYQIIFTEWDDFGIPGRKSMTVETDGDPEKIFWSIWDGADVVINFIKKTK